ncbi:ABC transporter substrate-binding protein [Rhodococcus triatomae]|uniref:Iron complex transport system substrate-binding protein n=1 Tax=Rhodococcus triatomae TaxID=300028 RepID=A0A1G8DWY5_9NOCA|nr:ABC transporter substrate-binding protein [Rhodococcus triatomae]QNG18328.1 ABC transporter substrate-binding protein [Rhodococcus triatomae]QNG22002.1 ABC transporter substrate-binding protein [Rhodococcus triatomae]SDH62081.1 iron complex transport system substrate-binding protein [Rhodococcus triatomae]
MRSKSLPLLAVAAVSVLLASCSGPQEDGDQAGSETIDVTTPVGAEIEMPAEPQAALGFYTTDVDLLVTLGFDLAGAQPIRDTYSSYPEFFPQEELAGVTTFGNFPEYNLEAVVAAEPDFILNGLGYEEGLDGQLQQIAPTYTYNAFDGSDWRDSAERAARDLGRESQWQEWVDAYDARVADIRGRLDEAGIDPVVADIAWYEGQATAQCRGVPCLVFADLGLRMAPLTNADENGVPSGDAVPLSPEQLDRLADIDVVFTAQQQGQPIAIEEDANLRQNPLWAALTFVQDEEIHGFDTEIVFGSPSGQDAFLTLVEQALLG